MKKTTKSDIINRIKSEFNSIVVPDLASDIMAKYHLRPKEAKIVKKTKVRKSIFSFKNAMSFAMLLVISLVVVLVAVNNQAPIDQGDDPSEELIVTQTSNVMAIESISALYMFSEDSNIEQVGSFEQSNFVEQLSFVMSAKGGPTGGPGMEPPTEIAPGPGQETEAASGFQPPECPPKNDKEMAVRMHRFLILSEQMIQNKEAFKIEELESDSEEYAFKEKITIETYLENSFEYIFYYNIIDGSIKDDEYSFSGFIIYNDLKYEVLGTKKTTLEKKVLCLKVIDKSNEENWVEVEKDLESIENDTEYKVYFNNQFSFKTTMKFKKDKEEPKINFEYRKNDFVEEFVFERSSTKERRGISVKHRTNNQEKEVDVYIVDNQDIAQNNTRKRYEYRFGQDEKFQFNNPF